MKKKLYKAGTEAITVLFIYVALMATVWAVNRCAGNCHIIKFHGAYDKPFWR